jgi:UDP-N-acetylglucosamine/UDP-N-acetylgalactosamine diphosphorylase
MVKSKVLKINDKLLQPKIEKLFASGQGHIFKFWEKLDNKQRQNLLRQVSEIDLDLLDQFIDIGQNSEKNIHSKRNLTPAEVITLADRKKGDAQARNLGETILRQGKVAALVVAGGQGTRLGYAAPKGIYPVTPVKKKSLFQLHAEKLLALNRKYKITIPWYIMTSRTNHDQTVNYFQDNDYLGYRSADIYFFSQDMIPAIDQRGKLILDAPDHFFMNPNGHGGSLQAVWKSGALADMKDRGIQQIFYFQVDNVLLQICDPVYIGYHVQQRAEMSCKVVRKSSPEERVGVVCYIDGRSGVVEYSDLSKEDMYALNPAGGYKYWAGSIGIHMLSVDFVEQENKGGFKLPYHIALKSIPYLDEQGALIEPREKNGIKFETFVFDALLDAEKVVSLEVQREEEFSPLKNEKGEESPITIRQSLVELYANWLEQAGYKIQRDKETKNIEISPLFALDAEELKQRKFQIDPQADEIYLGP